MISSFRVGMGQILVEGGRAEANLRRARAAIKQAAAEGAKVVVLPECLDLGWADPSARDLAQPIPGPHALVLAEAAKAHEVHVAAGLVERAGDRLYNAAVLVSSGGKILLHHRKINELDIALDLYSVGDRLGVAETELGILALNICADNFANSLAIGHVLARMGAHVILSPSAWVVPAEHDHVKEPYGKLWLDAYSELARLYDLSIIGVSNVGPVTGGPWRGRKAIGCSLAVGPSGRVLGQGPYADEAVVMLDVTLHPRSWKGTDIAKQLRSRGYDGP